MGCPMGVRMGRPLSRPVGIPMGRSMDRRLVDMADCYPLFDNTPRIDIMVYSKLLDKAIWNYKMVYR